MSPTLTHMRGCWVSRVAVCALLCPLTWAKAAAPEPEARLCDMAQPAAGTRVAVGGSWWGLTVSTGGALPVWKGCGALLKTTRTP